MAKWLGDMRGFGISHKRNAQLGYYLFTYVRRILWQNSRTGVGQHGVQTKIVRSRVAIRVVGRKATVPLRSNAARHSVPHRVDRHSVRRKAARSAPHLPMRRMPVPKNHGVGPYGPSW